MFSDSDDKDLRAVLESWDVFERHNGILDVRVKIPIPHFHITSGFVMLLYVRRMRYACLHVIVS